MRRTSITLEAILVTLLALGVGGCETYGDVPETAEATRGVTVWEPDEDQPVPGDDAEPAGDWAPGDVEPGAGDDPPVGADPAEAPDAPWGDDDPADDNDDDPAAGDDPVVDPDDDPVAEPAACEPAAVEQLQVQALAVLEENCASCHTPGGDSPVNTKIDNILDPGHLIERGILIPGKPSDSMALVRMGNNTMPPQGIQPRPDEADIANVEAWIACLGIPEVPVDDQFVTEAQMLGWMVDDLSDLQLNERRFIRYFSLVHLYNSGAAESQIQHYHHALSKLVNSLSWNAKVVPAVAVDQRGLVLRIDIRDYDWDDVPVPVADFDGDFLWEVVEDHYPYAVFDDQSADAEFLVDFTESDVPFVHGDWFAAEASTPPLYHALLGIPETLAELETLIGVAINDNIELGDVARAGFTFSNVSANNRVIERHELGIGGSGGLLGDYDGSFWLSYDFADNKGLQNIFQHPVDFVNDGGELIWSLPNGFQAYMIIDAAGTRLDSAPTNIVADPYSFPPEVTNGLSCMSCHWGGMNAATDDIRDIVLAYQDQYPQDIIGEVVKLYPPADVFDELLDTDSWRFEAALTEAGVPLAESREEEPITALALQYDDVMSLTEVSTTVGLTEEAFVTRKGINRLKGARAELASLVDKGGTLKREVYDESFRDIMCFLDIAKPVNPRTSELGCAVARLCNIGTGIPGDATLNIGGVELQALEGKCSPCRAVPVGDAIEAKLEIIDVVQQVDSNTSTVVNVVDVQFSGEVELTFDDEEEYLLSLIPQVSGGQVVDLSVELDLIQSPATCDDVP